MPEPLKSKDKHGMPFTRLPEIEAGEVVFGGLGFARLFTRAELSALGDEVGRRTAFDDGAPDGMELCAFVRG